MKITKKLAELLEKVSDAQVKYHITGGQVENEYEVQYETSGGTTVTYKAKRNWHAARGLSYVIWKIEVSIAKGVKETYIGTTHEFGREDVMFI